MRALKNKYVPFYMWLFPLLFFAYQFILRLWPGITMHQIMHQFSIDASHFGLLAAFYYYGYAGMQIPVAGMLERFGAQKIIFLFATLCGLATLMFTYTDNFYVALLSRFLIGAGSAAGFLGVSKVVSEWFDASHYAKMIGFSFTLGLMGAIYGGKPITLMIEKYQWHTVATALGLLSIVIGCSTYLLLRSPQKTLKAEPFTLARFKFIGASKLIWGLALSNLLMVGTLEGFADVWGVPYLVTVYNLDKSDAAGLISFIFFGMVVGGPLLAWFSKKIGNYAVIALCGVGMALAFTFLLVNLSTHPTTLACLFFIVGILCCYQVLIFAAGSELVAPQNLGVCIAFLNSINMLGGSFFHTLIGRAIDLFWKGNLGENGVRVYSLEAYQYSLSIIPFCAFLGAVIIVALGLRVKRTLECKTARLRENDSRC